jgi:hypothetical protein
MNGTPEDQLKHIEAQLQAVPERMTREDATAAAWNLWRQLLLMELLEKLQHFVKANYSTMGNHAEVTANAMMDKLRDQF